MATNSRQGSMAEPANEGQPHQRGIKFVKMNGEEHPVGTYELSSKRCVLYDLQQCELLQHTFSSVPKLRIPWTHKIHGPQTVAWTTDQDVIWYGPRCDDRRPVYRFWDHDTYKHFQCQVLSKDDMVAEFAMVSVAPNRPTSEQRSEKSYVKVWQAAKLGKSITIPLRAGNDMEHLELLCSWLDCTRKESKHSKEPPNLQLRFKPSKQQRDVLTKPSRTLTVASGISAKFPKLRPHRRGTAPQEPERRRDSAGESLHEDMVHTTLTSEDLALDKLRKAYDHFELTFTSGQECTRFVNAIVPDPVRSDSTATTHPPSVYSQTSPVLGAGDAVFSDLGSLPSTNPSSVAPAGNNSVPPRPDHDHEDHMPGLELPASAVEDPSASPTGGLPPRSGASLPYIPPGQLPPPATQVERPPERIPMRPRTPPEEPQQLSQPSPVQPTQADQRKRFWSAQTDTAPVANAARPRAEHNKGFYESTLRGEQVRILRILPWRRTQSDPLFRKRSESDPLFLTFSCESLEASHDSYEALSYCWGPGVELADITVNETSGFQISKHLEQGLRRLRLPEVERVVWIDAICINQASLDEMNHQVPMMGDIYRQARRTIIWISELSETEMKVTCPRTDAADEEERKRGERTLCAVPGGSARDHDNNVDKKLQKLLQPFHDRLEREDSGDVWWKRLWCVQEFHFSSKPPSVYIGQHAIGWTHFATIFQEVVGVNGPLSLFDKLRTKQERTMHDLVATTGAFKCSDPRDRIYALLNMTKDHEGKPSPDYANSILEVLEEVTHYFILESDTLDVLLDQRIDRSCGAGYGVGVLPTWMPDFTCLQPLAMTRGMDEYCAGGTLLDARLCHDEAQSQNIAPNMTSPRILRIKAMAFDSIEHLTKSSEFPSYESSPSGCLIYGSMQKPGQMLQRILKVLHVVFEPKLDGDVPNLDRYPRIGRLMLEYLFEERRNHVDELDWCTGSKIKGRDRESLEARYPLEYAQDMKYAEAEKAAESDEKFIRDHWQQRLDVLNEGKTDVKKIINADVSPWQEALASDDSVGEDFQVALDFENLFCYARQTKGKYYFTDFDYHKPMRRDVLKCKDLDEVRGLKTQIGRRHEAIEIHEYSDKSRQKEFFRTYTGYVGLGPAGMRRDDEMVVPLGASRAFILRPCRKPGEPGKSYTLVGEAVLPGIMHGPWVNGREDKAEYFDLR